MLIIFSLFLTCTSVTNVSQKILNPADELKSRIDDLLAASDLQNSHISLYVESISQDRVLYHKNENRLFVPASNMKLFTSASALFLLGDDFKFKTTVLANGKISGDTLSGDLIIVGGGDPTFSGRFYNNNIIGAFESWGDSLRKLGIKVITGTLLADNSFFDDDVLAKGWDWDDLPFWYAAQSSALSLNDNCVDLSITPADSISLPLNITVEPCFAKIDIINNTRTAESDSCTTLKITRKLGQNKIILSGNYPLHGGVVKRSVTVNNPLNFFLSGVENALCQNGITILGDVEKTVGDTLLLFNHYSPHLREIMKVINKRSHNFYAEQLLKTMGAILNERGSYESGVEVVSNWAEEVGIDENEFIMVDGSGLSRKNYITPMAVAKLLRYMTLQKNFLHFYNSLSAAAVDGTLKYRMVGSTAAQAVHAKTGSMSHIRNLSGYLRGRDGELYLFVMMMNNFSVPSAQISALQDDICTLLYDYSVSNTR